MKINSVYKGIILLLLSAFGFGFLPIFALFAYKGHINVNTLLFIRFFLTAGLLFIYFFLKGEKICLNKEGLFWLFILGGICYNLQSQSYFSAVKYIPASLAVLFLYTYPAVVTILSLIVDKAKINWKIGIAIGISFVGLVMILGTSIGKINGIGVLLALGASLVYSIYIVIGNRILMTTSALVTTAFVTLFSALGILIAGSFTGRIDFHFESGVWFPILGLVFFSTILAIVTFFQGMRLLGPAKASIISMMEPVFTVILSALLLGEQLKTFQLIGGAVVLAGAVLVIWSRHPSQTTDPVVSTEN